MSIGVVHSHPQGYRTGASSLDHDMDAYFAGEFAMHGGGRPYISLRVAKDEDGRFTFSGDAWWNGERMTVTELLTICDLLSRESAEFPSSVKGNAFAGDDAVARLIELLGGEPVTRLRKATVGIVGSSGTGSPAGNVLARAGVGKFVLVDPKLFTGSNHERFLASML